MNKGNNKITELRTILQRESQNSCVQTKSVNNRKTVKTGKLWKQVNKNVKNIFINVWRKSVFDIYFTEFGTALTTILPILFQYCYKYCYSDNRNLWAVMKAGGLALLITTNELTCLPTINKGNNKITELRTILQRESQNS
jgi:hypothetical protein